MPLVCLGGGRRESRDEKKREQRGFSQANGCLKPAADFYTLLVLDINVLPGGSVLTAPQPPKLVLQKSHTFLLLPLLRAEHSEVR